MQVIDHCGLGHPSIVPLVTPRPPHLAVSCCPGRATPATSCPSLCCSCTPTSTPRPCRYRRAPLT